MKVKSHTDVGGYPIFYIVSSDDGMFQSCASCVNSNRVGKNVTHCLPLINWESPDEKCSRCGGPIHSAYGE